LAEAQKRTTVRLLQIRAAAGAENGAGTGCDSGSDLLLGYNPKADF
jgi:hypothetical protein